MAIVRQIAEIESKGNRLFTVSKENELEIIPAFRPAS
jgi:hypothetical protein